MWHPFICPHKMFFVLFLLFLVLQLKHPTHSCITVADSWFAKISALKSYTSILRSSNLKHFWFALVLLPFTDAKSRKRLLRAALKNQKEEGKKRNTAEPRPSSNNSPRTPSVWPVALWKALQIAPKQSNTLKHRFFPYSTEHFEWTHIHKMNVYSEYNCYTYCAILQTIYYALCAKFIYLSCIYYGVEDVVLTGSTLYE